MPPNSASTTFQLGGLADIRETLKALPRELQDKVMSTALNRAAKPLVAAVKLHARRSERTGALRESIGALVKRGKGGGAPFAVIGPRRGYYRGGAKVAKGDSVRGADNPANYAHLVEFGHHTVSGGKGARLRQKTAIATGWVPAKPFMRPGLAAASREVGDELARGVADGIDRQLKRLVKSPRAAG